MRFLRFFKGHVLAVLVTTVLLIVQANCDLALPSYMSGIVDVGIQQGGIASAVPDTIRAQSLSDLELFMSADDAGTVEAAYGAPDANGVRAYVGSPAEAEKDSALADAMGLPETIVLSLEQGVDQSMLGGDSSSSEAQSNVAALAATPEGAATLAQLQQILDSNDGKVDMDYVRLAAEAGLVTNDQLTSAASSLADSMGSMSGSIVGQRAVQYVQQEYTAQGIDLDALQTSYLSSTAAVMFGYCLASLVAAVLVGLVAARTGAAIGREVRHATFAKVMRFSPAEVGKYSQASLITRCTNDAQQIQTVVVMIMRMVILAPITGIVALVRVLATHTGLEWTIGVALIVVCAAMGLLFGFTMPKFKMMQRLVDRVNLNAREMLDGLMPIRSFGRQSAELDKFDAASTDLMDTQLFTNRAMSLAMPIMMLVMNGITVLIVWFGAHGVNDGVMQVGDMMAFISYTMQIVMSFMILAMVAVMLPRASVAADRVCEVLDEPLSITDPVQPSTPGADAPRGEVVFDDVSFRYPDADADVIEHVSLRTAPGRTTAIIGSTGSGKSTLVQLIPRLYDVTAGSVTMDGIDVRKMTLADLRGRIGYVPQQGLLFAGTVGSNIRYGRDDITERDARAAADTAQASEFVSQMDGGLEADISQRGANVSGGQRQRLCIARALAVHPEVLVFDDSFSALDYATDAHLREALATEASDVAVVVVAQRISSIMHADEILVLDEGVVVGRGTHRDLLRTCPTYLEIATSQLSACELGLEGGEA
ncbi:MAG: ABC transporter ATP-binding protein/permease [Atopobiaceae bacterium]|jgi:ATP-binding cassette subfamily B protein|nr:ABC transporter ATP-binding protein/permease [Atopobiaceae bacterium]MCH4180630.1 ABC transporter ATP-binding protein/permease [Atopobiaceae bacterium]MCH4230606.1 ABC transporter ATP-binding protein/permease [Atopobiaceae bacterium]MCH4277203.1 ABC transporter ATP-binding protein/permease [Atopobiaceae bacterium]MCI1227136.1 ABC transporter ATP-binding protein/permease [Atopobiaceae bacterium]